MDDFHEEGSYARADDADPHGPRHGQRHAFRGLRWYSATQLNSPESAQGTLLITTRGGAKPSLRSYDLGFRCARHPS